MEPRISANVFRHFSAYDVGLRMRRGGGGGGVILLSTTSFIVHDHVRLVMGRDWSRLCLHWLESCNHPSYSLVS